METVVLVGDQAVPSLAQLALDDGTTNLILDNRLCINVPSGQVSEVAWFAAQALAIGGGRPCFPGPVADTQAT